METRYALHLAPRKDSVWGRFGEKALAGPARRLGLHACLKPPFALAADARLEDLAAELNEWCATLYRFFLPPLYAARMHDYAALVPSAGDPRIERIADECVLRFDRYRAPEPPRCPPGRRLTPRQAELLLRWGSPDVLDQFRFHMPLTGTLAPDARPRFALPAAPLEFDAISLVELPEPEGPTRLVSRCALRVPAACAV